MSEPAAVDLLDLGFDRGAHVALGLALTNEKGWLAVRGRHPSLAADLRTWARVQGHEHREGTGAIAGYLRSCALTRWSGAERAGGPEVVARAPASWGLAARGALVEAGVTGFAFELGERERIWADGAAELYAEAAAAQWDPERAIPWDAVQGHPEVVERALVQVLTYLIENETAALLVPTRFASRVHPHFQEIVGLLAITAADEARHVAVFSRRARMRSAGLGTSSVGGQRSLQTLVDEPDFAEASFLLSVLGEGSFLNLLGFLHLHAPDACTAEIMRLVAQDEARHVAFGMAHLKRHVAHDPALLGRLALAIERRNDALAHSAGLNADVFDALVILAAGSLDPAAIGRGHDAVVELARQMDVGRKARLVRLGFAERDAARLSSLHTKNFM